MEIHGRDPWNIQKFLREDLAIGHDDKIGRRREEGGRRKLIYLLRLQYGNAVTLRPNFHGRRCENLFPSHRPIRLRDHQLHMECWITHQSLQRRHRKLRCTEEDNGVSHGHKNSIMNPVYSFLFLLLIVLGLPGHVYAGDLDGDGLSDIHEDINQNGIVDDGETNYRDADTDGGGESDGTEIAGGRNPLDQQDDLTFDRDNDGISNGTELEIGTDPFNPDSDDDGILDGSDPFPLDTFFTSDNDQDGIADEWEERYNLTSTRKMDALLDDDGDGLSNVEEFIEGTDPLESDTDRDGVGDGMEKEQGSDPTENPCLLFAPPRVYFDDTKNHWVETFVMRLHRTKILPDHPRVIDGYTENGRMLFRPDQPISRFELLKIALLGNCIPLALDQEKLSLGFADLPSTPRPHENADRILRRRVVYTAVRHGIIEGYPDGTFRPDHAINRAEALKILLKSSNLPAPYSAEPIPFTDIQPSDWFAPFLERALWYNLLIGYDDLTFRPDQHITRAEAGKLLYLIMLVNPWINGYVLPQSTSPIGGG